MSLGTLVAPSGFHVPRGDGDLSINAKTTRCAAWWLLDLAPAWEYGARRGANRVMAGTPGTRAERRFRTSTVFTFQLVFGGRFTSAGAVSAIPPGEQLRANFAEARAAWINDPGGDGTVTSVLTDPNGATTYTWPVQPLNLAPGPITVGLRDAGMRATLTVEVPRGGWVA